MPNSASLLRPKKIYTSTLSATKAVLFVAKHPMIPKAFLIPCLGGFARISHVMPMSQVDVGTVSTPSKRFLHLQKSDLSSSIETWLIGNPCFDSRITCKKIPEGTFSIAKLNNHTKGTSKLLQFLFRTHF